MKRTEAKPKGIEWSAPVLIRKDGAKLAVELPPQVAGELKAGPGDVLNFTRLPEGDIQIWVVKKSGYSSLKDMGKKK
jgi:antitoxin component of MazEF toxin-antitoxin module